MGLKLDVPLGQRVSVKVKEVDGVDGVFLEARSLTCRTERYLFPHRHLLGIEPLSPQDITAILDQARAFEEVCERPEIKIVPALRKRLIVNLFFENSTRTRNSFEIAEKRLSAEIINFDADTSSLSKGETLIDTAMNLESMRPDLIVMRHAAPGAHALLARHMKASIVNAGDGATNTPPRPCWTPTPCASTSAGWKACASPSSATSATAGWCAPTSGSSPGWA